MEIKQLGPEEIVVSDFPIFTGRLNALCFVAFVSVLPFSCRRKTSPSSEPNLLERTAHDEGAHNPRQSGISEPLESREAERFAHAGNQSWKGKWVRRCVKYSGGIVRSELACWVLLSFGRSRKPRWRLNGNVDIEGVR